VTDSRNSLEVYRNRELIFSSPGKWLYPLFELEKFLVAAGISGQDLYIEDKVTGRGAAFLIVRLGIRKLHTGLLSRLGQAVLEDRRVDYTADTLVDKIECRTEELLAGETDPEKAHALLLTRARAASGACLSA
jgi:zinc transport system ATP-binding protein